MNKIVLRLSLLALCFAMAMPFAKAQVHVGDILCDDDEVVSCSGLETLGRTPVGVVFYVDATGKHGWAVALNELGDCAWGPNSKDTPLRNYTAKQQATTDLNGYSNTKTIQEGGYDIPFPAFDSLNMEKGWYLPAIGQLKRLFDNLNKVNESLSAVNGLPIPSEVDCEYWSSTEYSVCNAWFIDSFGELHYSDQTYNGDKDGRRRIRGVKNF